MGGWRTVTEDDHFETTSGLQCPRTFVSDFPSRRGWGTAVKLRLVPFPYLTYSFVYPGPGRVRGKSRGECVLLRVFSIR